MSCFKTISAWLRISAGGDTFSFFLCVVCVGGGGGEGRGGGCRGCNMGMPYIKGKGFFSIY